MNTGSIVEHFSDSEYKHHLAKLAFWDHPALKQDVALEFKGVMDSLKLESVKSSTERLLQKQRLGGSLTSSEKDELARLLIVKRGDSG